jgi:hypothetical protein
VAVESGVCQDGESLDGLGSQDSAATGT